MRNVTMGNQQITAFEVGWLAGIIDGEGYVGLQKEYDRRAGVHIRIDPQIHITNCDESIVLKARDIMRKIEVNPYIRATKSKGVKKDIFILQIHRLAPIARLLDVVIPYMTGTKRERAILVCEFCKLRQVAPTFQKTEGIGKQRSGRIKPYTKRETEIFDLCKQNQKRGISETIRQEQRSTSEIWKVMESRQLEVVKI